MDAASAYRQQSIATAGPRNRANSAAACIAPRGAIGTAAAVAPAAPRRGSSIAALTAALLLSSSIVILSTAAHAARGAAESPSPTAMTPPPPAAAKRPKILQMAQSNKQALAPEAAQIDDARTRRRAKQEQLKQNERQQIDLRADLRNIRNERARTSKELIDTAALIKKSEGQLTLIEGRIKTLGAQETIMRDALAQSHGKIAKLLAAMQRMGRNPPPVMITRRKDALKMVRSAMLLAATFPEMRSDALELGRQLSELQTVVDRAKAEAKNLRDETQRLNGRRSKLAGLMEEKRRSLGQRQAQLASLQRETRQIEREASSLGDLIAKYDRAVAARTRLGNYNRAQAEARARARAAEEKRIAASPPAGAIPQPPAAAGLQPAAKPAAPAAVTANRPSSPGALPSGTVPRAGTLLPRRTDVPAKDVEVTDLNIKRREPGAQGAPTRPAGKPRERKMAVLIPKTPKPKPPTARQRKAKLPAEGRDQGGIVLAPKSNISLVSPGRLQPAIPFSRAKRRLPMPAHGRQVVSFGEKTQYGARSKGIVISTRHSAQITAPADGWVVYAGEFRSYGQLLIINAGEGYHLLLAGMSQIDVQLGQFVLAGEPVGTMSARPRKSAGSSAQAPVLYVEFRRKGRPIDPTPWWSKS